MSNKVFNILRFLTEAGLPLTATMFLSFSELLKNEELVVVATGIGIVNVLLAGVLKYLRAQYNSGK